MFNGMKFNTFTLDNEIQVLAISDERFVKSSAALAVMAGSMQNPNEHLGLAHFLEHMLFLGTEDYPEVGEYESYLNKNGGGHNAYTSIDHTNYFFDVSHDAFEGALQRFSRFFVCPTFDPKYVEREKNAVHSEHEKNLKEDSRREYRFLQLMTDPEHPFSKFATGDKDTLGKANRDVVMDFYKKHYSSNLMTLVLMSDLEGKELETLANKYFSDISNQKNDQPEYTDDLFLPEKIGSFHQIESVRDQDILKVSFSVPDDLAYWDSKPTQFLAHIIGEEGEGSLLSYLKQQGWALGLETSTWWRMFHVRVQMTEQGKAHYQQIIKAIFSFIKLVEREGLKEYIFNERQAIAQAELDFLEPSSSMSRASNYSASMLYFPVDQFLSHYYLFHKYSPEDFKLFLDKLNVDNMQISLFTKDDIKGETEPYYRISYNSSKMPAEFISELRDIEIYKEFKYPQPNPYIPDNLELVAEPDVYEPKDQVFETFSRIYSQTDTDLKIPKASISLSFISDKISGDPKNYLCAKLFSQMKREELNEWGYPVRLGGMSFGISHGYNTITIDVSGYSQHLTKLLQNLIFDEENGRVLNHVEISEERFVNLKKKMAKALKNRTHDAAYQQLLSENAHFFSTASIHYSDYMDMLDEVSIEDVNNFIKSFFEQVSVRCFSYGNIETGAIKPVIKCFFEKFQAKGFTEKDVELFENKFPKMTNERLFLPFSGGNHNNGQLSFYVGTDWTIENQAYFDVLAKLIEQPFFTELRTHQQLGYVVAAFTSASNGFCGVGSLIQSQTHSAEDIFNRSHAFLKDFLAQLPAMITAEDLTVIKSALVSEISMKPNSMRERLSRFTMMAGTYNGDFEFLHKLCKRIESIDLDSMKKFVEKISDIDKGGAISFHYSDSTDMPVPTGFSKLQSYSDYIEKAEKIQPYKNSKNFN